MAKEIVPFKCPKCGSTHMEEIIKEAVISSSCVLFQTEDGEAEIEYRKFENSGGYVDRYQCRTCGYVIVDDNSPHADDGLDEHALLLALQELNGAKNVG